MRAESESGQMNQAANHIHAVYNILEALGFTQHDTLHLYTNLVFSANSSTTIFPRNKLSSAVWGLWPLSETGPGCGDVTALGRDRDY